MTFVFPGRFEAFILIFVSDIVHHPLTSSSVLSAGIGVSNELVCPLEHQVMQPSLYQCLGI